jgi:hypothetical protein
MTFDPVLHEYRDGEIIIESVTQILKRAGLIDDRWFSEEARDRAARSIRLRTLRPRRPFDNAGRHLSSLQYVNAFAASLATSGLTLSIRKLSSMAK